ncbi:MAG: hypothetical protein ACTIIT_08000, partial [Brevibacterium linens]
MIQLNCTRPRLRGYHAGRPPGGKEGAWTLRDTPTVQHAFAAALAGSHIVTLDGTRRERPDGTSLARRSRAASSLWATTLRGSATPA